MNPEIDLDPIDLAIVDQLLEDGRRTLAEIGKAVGLSAPAVKRRLDRLEETGVIVGYSAHVDYAKLGRPNEAFTELRFAGRTKLADIAGLVPLRVRDVADLTRVIDLLRRTGKVTGTKTLIVLASDAHQSRIGR